MNGTQRSKPPLMSWRDADKEADEQDTAIDLLLKDCFCGICDSPGSHHQSPQRFIAIR